jgi:iron(II)-dependent oxidoreductase
MVVQTPFWKLAAFIGATVAVWLVLWMIHPWLFAGFIAVATLAVAVVGCRILIREQRPKLKQTGVSPLLHATSQADFDDLSDDSGDLVEQMVKQGRYALLLRPQIASNLAPDQKAAVMERLDEQMALVPDGDVVLKASRYDASEGDDAPQHERQVHVEAIFLDRYPVTNKQFKAFVNAGGYEQISLWDPTVWPAILDFVDSTGHPGPKYWKDGSFLHGQGDHPVVGVCWYEASAYARWVGKRLPSDPEWVKAGAWPVAVPGGKPLQRKHPWGDTMNRSLANLWSTGLGHTVSVHEMHNGGTVGGIYQLIGNVWEWTTSNFGAWDPAMRRLDAPTQLKSIRGGAFDTYFETQANCQFQSGDCPMSRKHNIGFRCAISVCDLGNLNSAESRSDADEVDEPNSKALASV